MLHLEKVNGNNVCPFINKEKEQLTKSSLSLALFD